MTRQNAEGVTSRCVRWLLAIQIAFAGVLMMTTSGQAGVLLASWTAPTTNTDGSALTNLAFYRVYYSTSDSPCPGNAYFEVASPTPTPAPNQTLSFQLTSLTTVSIYRVAITAVNTSGKESSCSMVASAISRDDSTALPVVTQGHTTPTTQNHSVITAPSHENPATSVQSHDATGSATTTPTMQDHFVTTSPSPQDAAPTPAQPSHAH